MHSFSIFARKFAPLLASIFMVGSCCYLYDLPLPTPPPPPTTAPSCQISFTNPNSGEALPAKGAVTFSWTSVSNAEVYILSLDAPGGGSPNNYDVHDTSRVIYMDAFQSGNFSAVVQARNGNSDILCQAKIQFTTNQTVKAKKGGPANPATPPPALPPPVFLPPPPAATVPPTK